MALYRVREGIRILTDDLSDGASDLVGTGLPGGDTGLQDDAQLGSTYKQLDLATQNLQLWFKVATAGNDNTDWIQVSSTSHVTAVVGDRMYSAENFITDGETVTASLEALDLAVAAAGSAIPTRTTGVTASTVVGSVATADVDVVTWRVSALEVATPANRITGLITATHDGAGAIDFSFHDIVSTGMNIDGIVVGVAVVGANLELSLAFTDSSDVSVKVLITDEYN